MRLRGHLPLLAFGALAVFLAAAAHISIAFAQYRVNGSLSTSDQGAYMNFAKASALPGLMIHAAFMLIMASLRFLRGTASLQDSFRVALHAAVSVLVFFALLFPYFNESKER